MNRRLSTTFLTVICTIAFFAFTINTFFSLKESQFLGQSPKNSTQQATTSRAHDSTLQEEKVNLWLLVCETRNTSNALASWMFTAKQVQTLAASNDHNGTSSSINLVVDNICNGLAWQGFKTKVKTMTEYLDHIVASKSNSTRTSDKQNPQADIVMFTDSDSFFNPWAVTVSQVLDRFHIARKGKPILISAEPNCWNGSPCNQNVINEVYPNAVRSSCPQFVNSGQYMGYAESLLTMMKSEEMSLWRTKTRIDDQQQLSLWYAKHTDMAQLDVDSLVFRNLITGYVDSRFEINTDESVRSILTCGSGDAIRNCSYFKKPYWGWVNSSSLEIELVPFPNCTISPDPFSVHGPGPSKRFAGRLVGQLQSDYKKKYLSNS
mmetsp:Transcript_15841/g.29892  ORF Transcript_15841/g.29892 Transcript_15841/m.29892 type:complete len:377 (-) Transcript_15841:119-1249(-)